MTRKEVYKLIDGERDYQNKWSKQFDDKEWHPSDWLNFIMRYVGEAMSGGVVESKSHYEYYLFQMDKMRKIAALAVAAMEYNETPKR